MNTKSFSRAAPAPATLAIVVSYCIAQSKVDSATHNGAYLGDLSANPYDPDSVSNPYGRYGSQYSPDSINNPYGAGSPYAADSPTNPYGEGLEIYSDPD